MKFAKKVIVPIDFMDQLVDLLKPIHEMEFLAQSEIHFVHILTTITYPVYFGDFPNVYPIEEDRKMLEEASLALLVNMTEKVLPKNFTGKVIHRVLSSEDTKRRFSKYVTEEKADLVIIPTKKRHGVFESSFAQFVNKHTDCNVLLIKFDE